MQTILILWVIVLAASGIVNAAPIDAAFEAWWQYSLASPGGTAQAYVNIDAFGEVHSRGSGAIPYLQERLVVDRLPAAIVLQAIAVLKDEERWNPNPNPTLPHNLVINETVTPSPKKPLGPWACRSECKAITLVEHPRYLGNYSLRYSANDEPHKAAVIQQRVPVRGDVSYNLSLMALASHEGGNTQITVEITWVGQDARMIGSRSMTFDIRPRNNARVWSTAGISVASPSRARTAIVSVSFVGLNLKSGAYVDEVRLVEID